MLIYIEDSGDPGLKVEKGSSKILVLVMLIFEDDLDAEETALKIKRLKQTLKKGEGFEFKFNKSNRRLRTDFLNQVKDCPFKVRALVVQKDKIDKTQVSKRQSIYSLALGLLLERNKSIIKKAKIRIDGKAEKAFRQQLTSQLRKRLGSQTLKNLRFRNSKTDFLIQLADMTAGSVSRSFSDKKDAKLYLSIIENKIDAVWVPEKLKIEV